jgi:hypothetical protein
VRKTTKIIFKKAGDHAEIRNESPPKTGLVICRYIIMLGPILSISRCYWLWNLECQAWRHLVQTVCLNDFTYILRAKTQHYCSVLPPIQINIPNFLTTICYIKPDDDNHQKIRWILIEETRKRKDVMLDKREKSTKIWFHTLQTSPLRDNSCAYSRKPRKFAQTAALVNCMREVHR